MIILCILYVADNKERVYAVLNGIYIRIYTRQCVTFIPEWQKHFKSFSCEWLCPILTKLLLFASYMYMSSYGALQRLFVIHDRTELYSQADIHVFLSLLPSLPRWNVCHCRWIKIKWEAAYKNDYHNCAHKHRIIISANKIGANSIFYS